MKLSSAGSPHLTYCTNIHPAESWAEVRKNLETHVVAVKRRIAPAELFGVGLRLSARAAEELCRGDELAKLISFLGEQSLYVFTINGFPYGAFHGERVKEKVYLPDWLDAERLAYTDRLASILAALLPAEPTMEGSISTVPCAYKPRVGSPADVARMAEHMIRHAVTLDRIHDETGKVLSLALEPEPTCYLETVAETVRFFEDHLFAGAAVQRFAELSGALLADAEARLRRHLGVCFDACHMAVEYEDVGAALGALRSAGIRIGKIQISAGLEVGFGGDGGTALEALRPFAEDVYLHQVVAPDAGGLRRWPDLPDALADIQAGHGGASECRIHFHVPLFLERLGAFRSTQPYLRELLAIVRDTPVSPHLEVETYTWDVLPASFRQEDVDDAIARELTWVRERLSP